MAKKNVLDKAISFISPSWGAKRLAMRQTSEELERGWNYDAGDHRAHNLNWHSHNESAELTDKWDREQVRARARDLERNSDQMNAIVNATVRNVYGSGWTLQAKVGDGMSEDYNELNKQIEEAWEIWKKPRNCDITGTQGFDELIRMCVRRKKIDGGILIKKCFTSKNDGFIPFKLQVLEVDELDDLQTAPKYKGNHVIGGIEYNSYKRPVGYWFRQYDIDGYKELEPVFVKANDVIFYFSKTRPSQLREMSDLTPTITRIRDVNQYLESVAVKERILACLSVFITSQSGAGTGFGRSGIQLPSDGGEESAYRGKTISPGMIMHLQPGESVQSVAPSGQTQDAERYVKMQQKMMAAGQGMSYEAVARDMSDVNYSSARQAAIEDERTFAAEQESLQVVLDEIYETFVLSLYLSGKLKIKKGWPSFEENKRAYMAHRWLMPAKKWIDPSKESTANEKALKTGQKTFQTLCAESGRDWKDVIDETSEALKYADEMGVDLASILIGTDKGGQETDAEPETETEDTEPEADEGAAGGSDSDGGGQDS